MRNSLALASRDFAIRQSAMRQLFREGTGSNNVEEQSKSVTVPAGANASTTFTLIKDDIGNYIISVSGIIKVIIVKPAATPTPSTTPGGDGGDGEGSMG